MMLDLVVEMAREPGKQGEIKVAEEKIQRKSRRSV